MVWQMSWWTFLFLCSILRLNSSVARLILTVHSSSDLSNFMFTKAQISSHIDLKKIK